jgi:hypothetical protein
MWSRNLTFAAAFALLIAGLQPWAVSAAEEPATQFTRLEKARLMLEHSRVEYERMRKGRELGINSDLEFQAKETAYKTAQLDYDEEVLAAAGAQQQVTVLSASKHSRDGKTYAEVKLSFGGSDALKNTLSLKTWLSTIHNVTVSLMSEAGVVISLPYVAHLSSLSDGETRTVTFVLLKDVDTAQIVLHYNGKEQRSTVYLLRDAGSREVEISTSQYSQDVETGASGVFNIAFVRIVPRNALFRILVIGLPADVNYEFVSETGARVSQISFSDEVGTVKLQLKAYLPKSLPEAVIDRAQAFYVVCVAPDVSLPLTDPQKAAGAVRLEMIPRGSGKIGLQLANLFHEVQIGQVLLVRAKMFNRGTRPIHNIQLAADVPVDWKVQVLPVDVPLLAQGAEVALQVMISPPAETATGEYEMKLRPESSAYGKNLETEEQVLRIRVAPRGQNTVVFFLLAAVVALLGVIGYFAVRLSRT